GAGNVIAVEAVRDLIAKLAFAPHEAKARVVVVEDAERLREQGSNAFLKTLEEPPARTHIVLVSSAPEQLVVTIHSRCQKVRFAPLGEAAVAGILEARGVPGVKAKAAAALSGGSASRAAELAEGDALERRRQLADGVLAAVKAKGIQSVI